MKEIKYIDEDKDEQSCFLIFKGDEFCLGLSLPNDEDECHCVIVLRERNGKFNLLSKESWSNCNAFDLNLLYDNLSILKKGNWNTPNEYNLYLKLKKKYDKN